MNTKKESESESKAVTSVFLPFTKSEVLLFIESEGQQESDRHKKGERQQEGDGGKKEGEGKQEAEIKKEFFFLALYFFPSSASCPKKFFFQPALSLLVSHEKARKKRCSPLVKDSKKNFLHPFFTSLDSFLSSSFGGLLLIA